MEKTSGFLMPEEPQRAAERIADFQEQQNLLGFFDLLIKVDKRVNPQSYESKRPKENKRGDDNAN